MHTLMPYIILIPLLAGTLFLFLKHWPEKWLGIFSAAIAGLVFVLGLILYLQGNRFFMWPIFETMPISFASFSFPALLFLAAAFFTILIIFYSFAFMRGKQRLSEYYGYILMTLGAAGGAFLAADFITLIIFWGILGITLYKLIGFNQQEAGASAKKTFIIVGGADAVMLIGISLFFMTTGSFSFYNMALPLNHPLSICAFLCLLTGALAKAGAFPLHTWVPSSAETTPSSMLAFLPASLDKLLGIYLLARLTLDIFILTPFSFVSLVLLLIGAITIISGVMMALMQHNFKKLLAYHAVSQVGYMIMGIGTGTMVGIAGGLFHMLNHTIYKTTLFLAGGAVKKEAKTAEIDQLGGLAGKMPFTFSAFLIAALAISGIPPLNGFFSKWMIYQGILELAKPGSYLWVIWLAAAMFGSALTLASFMKLLQAIFFGDSLTAETQQAKEVSTWMWGPTLLLAGLCILLGIFAYSLPLKIFILPYLGEVSMPGFFAPVTALVLLSLGILCGLLFYLISKPRQARVAPIFTGGENLSPEETQVPATHFYDTIKDLKIFSKFYRKAETGTFDLYEEGSKVTFKLSDMLKALHQGLLHTYLAWCLIGLVVLLIILYR